MGVRLAEHKVRKIKGRAMCYLVGNNGVPIYGSSRVLELRLAMRQSSKDLKCDAEVDPTLGSWSCSTRDITIEKLSCPRLSYEIEIGRVLSTLSQMITFTLICTRLIRSG